MKSFIMSRVEPVKPTETSSQNAAKHFMKLPSTVEQINRNYASYKFTVYRTAAKVVALQKALYTCHIPYKIVYTLMERHEIREVDVMYMVPPFQLYCFIHDIYLACWNFGYFSQEKKFALKPAAAELCSFFWNIFDPARQHSISALEIKVILMLLCKEEKSLYSKFFALVCHPTTKLLSKINFERLLNIITRFLTFMGEGSAYGEKNTKLVLEECYSKIGNSNGLADYQFYNYWIKPDAKLNIFSVLLELIDRIWETENLVHQHKCISCKMEPIAGIRFKCQSCKNLSLCMKCFASGFTADKHTTKHKMLEVFSEEQPTNKLSQTFAKLCSMFLSFSTEKEEDEKGFCNSRESSVDNDTELATIEPSHISKPVDVSESAFSTFSAIVPLQKEINESLMLLTETASKACTASGQLQVIIDKLQMQNTKLEERLKSIKDSSRDEISQFLASHHAFLVQIIKDMRNFPKTLSAYNMQLSSSTPKCSLDAQGSVSAKDSDRLNLAFENLTHSINGADLNRTYLEANKSDYSVRDVSEWFSKRRSSNNFLATRELDSLSHFRENACGRARPAESFSRDARDTKMVDFQLIVAKVKEIVDDYYDCENEDVVSAAMNMDSVLDNIAREEESRYI